MDANTCGCGQPLAHQSHLACNACMRQVPAELRSEYFDKARTKRGAPSYYAARREVVAELAKIHAAGKATA